MGLECGSMIENLPSMLKTLGSRPSSRKQQQSHTHNYFWGRSSCHAQKTFIWTLEKLHMDRRETENQGVL